MRPVLIAGGGIAGLTTALALAKIGRASILMERARHFSEVGAGLQISPNAASVLVALGLGDALDAVSHKPEFIRMRAARSGREVKRLAINTHCQSRFGHAYRVVHRADLLDVLLKAARGEQLITLHADAEVSAVDNTAGPVAATTADGRTFVGDVLVAADGVWSTVRTRVLGLPLAQPSGRSAWRTLIPAGAMDRQSHADVGLWMGSGAHLVHYPVRDGSMINLVAVVDDGFSDRTWDGETGSGDLPRHFWLWSAEARALIASKPAAGQEWRRWPLFQRKPEKYAVDGPIVLIGDAWHATLPFMAQGAAMAIEDAAVLAFRLSHHPDDPVSAIRQFQDDRQDRTARLVDLANRNGTIYHLSGPMAFSRNAVLKRMPADKVLSRLDWIYGWKPPALS